MRPAGSLLVFLSLASLVGCGSSHAGSTGAPEAGAAIDSGRTSARDGGRDADHEAARGETDAFVESSVDGGRRAREDGSLDAPRDGSQIDGGASHDASDGDGSHVGFDADHDSSRAEAGASDAHSRDAEGKDATGPACEITYPMGASPSSSPLAFPAWSMDPYHGCLICDPTVSLTAWTPAPNGTPCGGAGGTCQAGACSTGAALGSSCYYGADCESGYCADDEVTHVSTCAFSAGQPGDGCEIGSCANGTYCIPFTNCDPSMGSRCEIFYANVCL